MGVSDYSKACNLMIIIDTEVESSLNSVQYLTDVCHVLMKQQNHSLIDIATSILHQLGK